MRTRPVLFVALCSIVLCVLGARGISQQRSQAARQPAMRAAATILHTRLAGGMENQPWGSAVHITGRSFLQFRWSTKATGASAARWLVTDLPFGRAGAKTVRSQPLPVIPAPGEQSYFDINFTEFIPATSPKKPYVLSYYVYVILSDSAKKDLPPSSVATVTYGEPGAQTEFEQGVSIPSNEAHLKILALAQESLKTTYGFYNPVGEPQTHGGIGAFQRYKNVFGAADASIEVSGPTTDPTIYVGVPWKAPSGYGKFVYRWFRYTVDRQGRVVPKSDPGSEVPGSPAPPLPNPGAWSKYTTYNGIPGDDPPHWSPILVRSDSLTIARLHHDFQYPGGYEKTKSLIEGFGKNMANLDLTDRAMEKWQSVKLIGVVNEGWYTSGDYGADHTEDYHDGEDAPTGHVHEETDYTWAGLDWDMSVTPDPPYNYLASTVRPTVRVEMENFALGPLSRRWYWPQTDDWLQAVGRWVVDCGHTSYTEIHPPELLVASTQSLSYPMATLARVTVTGAYLGDTLDFVVNPPPRPSATSRMYYRILRADKSPGYDWKENVSLEVVERGTPGHPNHLYVRVVPTGDGTVIRYNTGMVGYCRTRRLQCLIECGWEGGTSTGTVRVRARASEADRSPSPQPVRGAYLFYRNADVPKLPWEVVRMNDDKGGFISLTFPIGPSFLLRPAGSGWNFAQPGPNDALVPARVVLKQDQTNDLMFAALADQPNVPPADLRPFVRYGRSLSALAESVAATRPVTERPGTERPTTERPATERPTTERPTTERPAIERPGAPPRPGTPQRPAPDPADAVNQVLRSTLIALSESGGTVGVKGNNLGYLETVQIFFRLKSLIGVDGQPIKNRESAVLVDSTVRPPSITLRGVPGGGVPGARVRARLLLGNDIVGYRVAAQSDVTTDHQGLAQFRVGAGTHVEEAVVSIEILENPANPWFLPKILGSSRLFYPGDATTNATDTAPGRLPYTLTGNALTPGAFKGLLAAKGGAGAGQHFLEELQEKIAFEQNVRKRLGGGDTAALKAEFKKLEKKQK